MIRTRIRWVPMMLALLMIIGAACGSDDNGNGNDAGGSAADQEAQEETPEEEPSPEDTGPPTIVASEFAFEAPDALPAGETTFQFENIGKQQHIAVFVELLKGKTLTDVNEFIAENGISGRPPSWAKNVPKAQGFAKPGKTSEFTAEFAPGTYAMLCFVRDKETKKSHAELGMTAEVTFE